MNDDGDSRTLEDLVEELPVSSILPEPPVWTPAQDALPWPTCWTARRASQGWEVLLKELPHAKAYEAPDMIDEDPPWTRRSSFDARTGDTLEDRAPIKQQDQKLLRPLGRTCTLRTVVWRKGLLTAPVE